MNLASRIEKLEKGAQVDVPPGARLYDSDGAQVDATVTRVPSKYECGEAQTADGTVRPIAPFVKITLEDIIRRARQREKKEPEESHASRKLPADILFLRVDGCESFYEIVNRARKRLNGRTNGGHSISDGSSADVRGNSEGRISGNE